MLGMLGFCCFCQAQCGMKDISNLVSVKVPSTIEVAHQNGTSDKKEDGEILRSTRATTQLRLPTLYSNGFQKVVEPARDLTGRFKSFLI